MTTRTRRNLLAERQAKRQQHIDDATARAKLLGLSLTCQSKPFEWHGTCTGLDGQMNGGLGCLCPCHDVQEPRP